MSRSEKAFLDPKAASEAIARMRSGDASEDVLSVIVASAEAYAQMSVEWGFESPQAGLVYATRNDMLIETMHRGRPEAEMLYRVSPEWVPLPKDSSS